MKYLLQRTPLSATLKREPVQWETTNKRLSEKSLRRLFWHRVNQPMRETLYIYRMFNSEKDEVIVP